jgi:hypothetical protein
MDPDTLNPVPLEGEAHSSYPLTVFDNLFGTTTFLTGWLLEGKIDVKAFEEAVKSVTEAWRVVGGRLYSVESVDRDEVRSEYHRYLIEESR